MKVPVLFSVCLVGCSGCVSVPFSDPSIVFGRVLVEAAKSVVRIDCIRDGRTVGHGSGFKISPTEYVTAAHVAFENCDDLAVWSASTPEKHVAHGVRGEAWHADKSSDTAKMDMARVTVMLSSQDWDAIPTMKFASKGVVVGQRVASLGYPGGFEIDLQMSQGHVSAINLSNLGPPSDNQRWVGGFSFTSLSGGGNSGGPVVNVEGEVVGILVGKNQNTNTIVAVPVDGM